MSARVEGAMALDPLTSLASIKAELEHGWKLFDDAYAALSEADWSRKFGKTWTFADHPYHLAYFDAMIAKSLAEGDHPPADRMHLRSMEIGRSSCRERV